METYQTKIINNIICSKLEGELNSPLAKAWVDKLEAHEVSCEKTLHRFHDVRDINAIHLSFDDLWEVAQRRITSYKAGCETLSVFLVSTPLNYGVARMYQALTDGTPFKIEVLYSIEEAAEFLGVDVKLIDDVVY